MRFIDMNGLFHELTRCSSSEQEMKIKNPQTVQDFKENINEFLKETEMNDFFAEDDDFLDQVARKAVKLKTDPSTTLKRPDDIKNLTRLALYQPVIYCGEFHIIRDIAAVQFINDTENPKLRRQPVDGDR